MNVSTDKAKPRTQILQDNPLCYSESLSSTGAEAKLNVPIHHPPPHSNFMKIGPKTSVSIVKYLHNSSSANSTFPCTSQ